MIRKFYDASPAEPAAAPTIAELMAKQGTKSEGADMKATITPLGMSPNIPEKKDEPAQPQEPAKPVESTPSATPAEPAKPEPPKQTESQPAAPEPPKEIPQPKAPTLQEVLKNHQPDVILKELGFDDSIVAFVKGMKGVDPKMVSFLNHWQQNNGDVTPYLKALTTDYTKMSDEDVMKHQLQQDYPKASQAQLDILFETKIVNAYKLDSDDDDEKAKGKLLLSAEADKFRDVLEAKKSDFLLPKPQQPKAEEPDEMAIQQQRNFELYQQHINESPLVKSMITDKKLVIGEGAEAYTHTISDPNQILNSFFDDDVYAKSFFTKETKPDGTINWIPDVRKQLFIHAALADFDGLIKGMSDHFKSLGSGAVVETIENVKPPGNETPSKSDSAPKSVAEAMAAHGVFNTGGR